MGPTEGTFARRTVLKYVGGSSVIGATGLAGCLEGGDGGDGGDLTPLSAVRLANGATSLIEPVIQDQGYDVDNGFELEVVVRADIGAYYADFASGTYDAIPIGVGTAASQFNQGVEMKILGGFIRPCMYFLAPEGESLDSMSDLEGATLGAPVGSGAYKTTNMLSLFKTGSTLEDLASNVVNAPGPVNPILELNQGNVDYALSWEPGITVQGANEDINFSRVLDIRERLQDDDALGTDGWYLVWAIQQSKYDEAKSAAEGLLAASQQVGSLIEDDLETFLDIVTEQTENPREPIQAALDSGRLAYEFTPINEIQSILTDQMDAFREIGIIDETPGEDIFGDIS